MSLYENVKSQFIQDICLFKISYIPVCSKLYCFGIFTDR